MAVHTDMTTRPRRSRAKLRSRQDNRWDTKFLALGADLLAGKAYLWQLVHRVALYISLLASVFLPHMMNLQLADKSSKASRTTRNGKSRLQRKLYFPRDFGRLNTFRLKRTSSAKFGSSFEPLVPGIHPAKDSAFGQEATVCIIYIPWPTRHFEFEYIMIPHTPLVYPSEFLARFLANQFC